MLYLTVCQDLTTNLFNLSTLWQCLALYYWTYYWTYALNLLLCIFSIEISVVKFVLRYLYFDKHIFVTIQLLEYLYSEKRRMLQSIKSFLLKLIDCTSFLIFFSFNKLTSADVLSMQFQLIFILCNYTLAIFYSIFVLLTMVF